MTKKEVVKLLLWATEALPEGAIRFRQGIGSGSGQFLLMDPELSQSSKIINKKVFYNAEDIIEIYKQQNNDTKPDTY